MAVVSPLRQGIKIFFFGILMGLCDLMPSVSGSSMAYLCGIYETLVDAISNPRRHFPFLVPLFLGICVSLLSFSIPLSLMMKNGLARALLFSFFIGISVACALRAFFESQGGLVFLLLGALTSIGLDRVGLGQMGVTSYPFLFCAGIACGAAMLFPAISGAHMLYLLGIYPVTIEHLAHFVATGNRESFTLLFCLGIGVLCGLFFASKLMHLLLERFREKIYGYFAGFILMALPRLWPFQSVLPSGTWYWVAVGMVTAGLSVGLGISLGIKWLAKNRGVRS